MPSPRDRLTRLLSPVHDDARAFARRLCRSSADGDDVFQDAVIRALHKIDHLRDDGAFRTWFYKVIISVQRSRCRRAFWRRLVPLAGGESEPADTAADQLAGAQRARAALARLPASQREAIVLFELEGFAVDEVARIQGSSVSAVKSRLSRGRERLRTIYVARFGVEPSRSASPALLGTNQ